MDAIHQLIKEIREKISLERSHGAQSMGTWFLGPKGESHELFHDLITTALDEIKAFRNDAYPTDPPWANTDSIVYKEESDAMRDAYKEMIKMLRNYSVPFNSYRYQGHMLWDNSLPAMAGYFGAMLHNQNNVAAEASPATTAMEIEVAEDLCRMVDYNTRKDAMPVAWGHITCDGTVANLEAFWSARNTKLFPFAAYGLLKSSDILKPLRDYKVNYGKAGTMKRLLDLDWWELLNLQTPSILNIPEDFKNLAKAANIDTSELEKIDALSFQNMGWAQFVNTYDTMLDTNGELGKALSKMIVVGPASAHYSMPKATTLLGLGSSGYHKIPVQENARVDINALRDKLYQCEKDKIPVLTVVCVMGTTEESAVDYLHETLEFRTDLRTKHFEFTVHADGAWGGYFASMLRLPSIGTHNHAFLENTKKQVSNNAEMTIEGGNNQRLGAVMTKAQLDDHSSEDIPPHEKVIITHELGLNHHTVKQLRALNMADTITIDPHKSGYAPYPAGSLLYRDKRMPEMIEITAPVVYHGGDAPTVGVWGVEGSKPGAAAACVFFSHQIIRPDQSGYGRILGRCNFNAKRMFIRLINMTSDVFEIAALHQMTEEQLRKIRSWSGLSVNELLEELIKDEENAELFKILGPDLTIISYAANPIINGVVNKNPEVTNRFNKAIFNKLTRQDTMAVLPKIVITGSEFSGHTAEAPIRCLRKQLNVEHKQDLGMQFLITTVMNPWLSDAGGGTRDMVHEVTDIMKAEIEDVAKAFKI